MLPFCHAKVVFDQHNSLFINILTGTFPHALCTLQTIIELLLAWHHFSVLFHSALTSSFPAIFQRLRRKHGLGEAERPGMGHDH